jgi:hypothetical protein
MTSPEPSQYAPRPTAGTRRPSQTQVLAGKNDPKYGPYDLEGARALGQRSHATDPSPLAQREAWGPEHRPFMAADGGQTFAST